MQERHVTVGGVRHDLDDPFFVLATQNPIEQEGTYPLPEAQLDRFMFMVHVDYPTLDQEVEIVSRTTGREPIGPDAVVTSRGRLGSQRVVRAVIGAHGVIRDAVNLASKGRPINESAPAAVKQYVA